MKLLIIGHGRHGKDSVAQLMQERHGLKFASSSMEAAKIFLYDKLRGKYGYQSFEECYADRHRLRPEWFREISAFNTPERSRLAKAIMENADIYVGMRSFAEILECKRDGVFDFVIWVDACKRLPEESSDSFDIDFTAADLIIDNNGSVDELPESVDTAYRILKDQM